MRLKCERCGCPIAKGHFYIEARRRDNKPIIPQRPGIDSGWNADPIVYIHIPNCEGYQ